MSEAVGEFLKNLASGKCPYCKVEFRGKQIGPCVYCEHCQARLYQGKVPKR